MKNESEKTSFRSLIPYIFLLWIVDIILTFALKFIFTGHFSSGTDDTSLFSHQVRMSTRIFFVFLMPGVLFFYKNKYSTMDLILSGILWLGLLLSFEWGGGILFANRSVNDILIGWNIFKGYFWPYVLIGVLISPLVMGKVLNKCIHSKN